MSEITLQVNRTYIRFEDGSVIELGKLYVLNMADAASLGTTIDGATAASVINDTDKIPITVSGTLKTALFSLFKSTLKTYNDTLYATIASLTNYFNKTTDTLDNISDGTTYKLLTAAKNTILDNTSGTNTGDNATNTQYSGLDAAKVDKADYTAADVILAGTGAGTYTQITLGASQILGKKATGATTNLTAAEVLTILNIPTGFKISRPHWVTIHIDTPATTWVSPVIQKTVETGQTLTLADVKAWQVSGTSFTFKIQESDDGGDAWADVSTFTALVATGSDNNMTDFTPTPYSITGTKLFKVVVTAIGGVPTKGNVLLKFTEDTVLSAV